MFSAPHNFIISSKVLINQDSWAWRKSQRALNILHVLYISFAIAAGGVVQRFPRSGVTKQPLEMPGDCLGGCAESLRRFVPADFWVFVLGLVLALRLRLPRTLGDRALLSCKGKRWTNPPAGYLGSGPDPAKWVLSVPGFYKVSIWRIIDKMIHFSQNGRIWNKKNVKKKIF